MGSNNNGSNTPNKVLFTQEEFEKIAQHLIFKRDKFRENILIPKLPGPVQIHTKEENMIETAVESCAFKSITSCIIGMLDDL